MIPAAEQGTGLHVLVGGTTAIFDDFAAIISAKLPLFIGVIIGLGFVLLLIAFRSLLVPATAARHEPARRRAPRSASSSPSSSGAGARSRWAWAAPGRSRPSCR